MINEWKEINDPKELFSLDPNEWEIQYFREARDDGDGWYDWKGSSWNDGTVFRARWKAPPAQLEQPTEEWREVTTLTEINDAVVARDHLQVDVGHGWVNWTGVWWHPGLKVRTRSRKMKKVKSLCWRDVFDGDLIWRSESIGAPSDAWLRFPAGDFEGEVEDDS